MCWVGSSHTHQRGELRWTSPVSNVELAATGALRPGLTLLIHYPKRSNQKVSVEFVLMVMYPATGEIDIVPKGK